LVAFFRVRTAVLHDSETASCPADAGKRRSGFVVARAVLGAEMFLGNEFHTGVKEVNQEVQRGIECP
jgi:hypothetical protein